MLNREQASDAAAWLATCQYGAAGRDLAEEVATAVHEAVTGDSMTPLELRYLIEDVYMAGQRAGMDRFASALGRLHDAPESGANNEPIQNSSQEAPSA